MNKKKKQFNFLFYVIKRLLMIVLLFFLISTAVFFMLSFTPGDPVILMLGLEASTEQVEELREELGLNDPLLVQYWNFMKDTFLKGDLGYSYRLRTPVINEIARTLPVSASLAILAIIVSSFIAIFLGTFSAIKQYSFLDEFTKVFVLAGVSMPSFWLGLMLILIFSVKLGLFPAGGWGGGWKYYVLPVLALATNPLAVTARLSRSTMLEVIRQDFIITCRAKGLHESSVIFKHALRNAAIPVYTLIGLRFGNLLTGAVVTETIFGIPGLGRLTISAVYSRDYVLIRGCILTIALIFAIINLIVDLTCPLLDPRTKPNY